MEHIAHIPLALLALISSTTAQSNNDGSSLATSIYGGGDSTVTPNSSATPPPATSTQDNNDSRNIGGLVNYYFVFLALFVIIAGMGAFFMYRRKKKAMMMYRHGQSDALQQDVNVWNPTRARRRYWQGSRWRSTDETERRDEGLNENGEAPPPYMPKARDEEHGEGVAVPMQTVSREQAGLKPPGYEEHFGGQHHTGGTSSTATQETGVVPQYR